MKVAITGGTGFVGGHLAAVLSSEGHEVVIVARGVDRRPWAREVLSLPGVSLFRAGIEDEHALRTAFDGCEAVAHCAGINREIGRHTYRAVHVQGTRNVVDAAEAAGVRRLTLVSFVRARPACGSAYHESKWEAEEIVRGSGLDWTVLKPGMMFGRGDHMVDHLSRALLTFPVFVGVGNRQIRPLDVRDAVRVLRATTVDGRLSHRTVALLGPTQLGFDDAARLVARAIGKPRRFIRAPLAFHRALAGVTERVMTVPLISAAQVRILEEEILEPARAPDEVPEDLRPSIRFDEDAIRASLPKRERFTMRDLRLFGRIRDPDRGGHIELVTRIAAPAERCFDLSRDIDLHQRSLPFSKEVAVAGTTSGLIGPGEFVTWQAHHLGRRWRMTSRITEFEPPTRFVDEAESGPFTRFRHEHLFDERRGTTTMTDVVDFALPFGFFGSMTASIVAGPYLRLLLRRRNRLIQVEGERSRGAGGS